MRVSENTGRQVCPVPGRGQERPRGGCSSEGVKSRTVEEMVVKASEAQNYECKQQCSNASNSDTSNKKTSP